MCEGAREEGGRPPGLGQAARSRRPPSPPPWPTRTPALSSPRGPPLLWNFFHRQSAHRDLFRDGPPARQPERRGLPRARRQRPPSPSQAQPCLGTPPPPPPRPSVHRIACSCCCRHSSAIPAVPCILPSHPLLSASCSDAVLLVLFSRAPRTPPASHPTPALPSLGLRVGRRRRHVSYLVTGPGSRHGLGAQPGTWSLADPCNGFQPG